MWNDYLKCNHIVQCVFRNSCFVCVPSYPISYEKLWVTLISNLIFLNTVDEFYLRWILTREAQMLSGKLLFPGKVNYILKKWACDPLLFSMVKSSRSHDKLTESFTYVPPNLAFGILLNSIVHKRSCCIGRDYLASGSNESISHQSAR